MNNSLNFLEINVWKKTWHNSEWFDYVKFSFLIRTFVWKKIIFIQNFESLFVNSKVISLIFLLVRDHYNTIMIFHNEESSPVDVYLLFAGQINWFLFSRWFLSNLWTIFLTIFKTITIIIHIEISSLNEKSIKLVYITVNSKIISFWKELVTRHHCFKTYLTSKRKLPTSVNAWPKVIFLIKMALQ